MLLSEKRLQIERERERGRVRVMRERRELTVESGIERESMGRWLRREADVRLSLAVPALIDD